MKVRAESKQQKVISPPTPSRPDLDTSHFGQPPVRGNQELSRLFRSARGLTPPALPITPPTAPCEREADRAADVVMSGVAHALPIAPVPASEPALRAKCTVCEEEVHREETADGPAVAPSAVHNVLASPGRPLDSAARAFFEPRFGADLSGVRVHDDSAAAASADAVQARAYTVASDVVFAAGEYAPHTAPGQRLLAHELAHVLQDGGGLAALRRQPDGRTDTAPAIGPPSFDPDVADLTGMSNEGVLAECKRVDGWLGGNTTGSSPDFPAYKRLRERLQAEREARITAGHEWMKEKGTAIPTAFYQLTSGKDGRTDILTVPPDVARGVPHKSLAQPIISQIQLEAFLVAHGIPQIDEPTYRRVFARPLPLTPHHVPLGPHETLPAPYGKAATGAEPLLVRLYYPDMATLPPGYPGYDLVGGGERSFSSEPATVKGQPATVTNETISGGHWVSVRMIQPGNASDDQIRAAVGEKVSQIVKAAESNRRPPRDSTASNPNTYRRVGKAAPERITVHLILAPQDAKLAEQAQRVAQAHLATIDYGPGGIPAPVEVRVTAPVPGRSEPLPLGPGASISVGALAGGVIAVVLAGGEMWFDAKDHPDWAAELAGQGGIGAVAGGTQAAIERAVVAGGGRFVPGAGAKLLGTVGRGVGAGVVSAGLEVYGMSQEDREHSGTEIAVRTGRAAAIGVASTEIGVAAGAVTTSAVAVILSSAGTGAAAGSVAPGVGTAIGFIVGLGVGIGAYYLFDKYAPGGRKDWDPNAR